MTLYSYRTICRGDGVRKGGVSSCDADAASIGWIDSEPTLPEPCAAPAGWESAIPDPGSQGLDPRTLRPERLKWLRDFAKSEPAAQIAAFPVWKDHCQPFHTPHAEVLREREASKHRQVMGRFALRGPLTGAPQGEGSAFPPAGLSPITLLSTISTAARAKARQGHTLPPFSHPW